jgi:hypothetical protein
MGGISANRCLCGAVGVSTLALVGVGGKALMVLWGFSVWHTVGS